MSRPKPIITAAILARSSSPDRPGGLLLNRALTPVRGIPVLAHIARRLKLCSGLTDAVLAVGDAEADHNIVAAAEELRLPYIAGHPHDVLRRLLLAAESRGAEHVIRINGNFPLIDPWALDKLIASHLSEDADYSSNSHYQGVVYGLGAEIVSVRVLRELADYGQPSDIYSGTRLFLRRPWDFNIHLQQVDKTNPSIKACVDFAGDEAVIEYILASHPEPDNTTVVEFFSAHPEAAGRSKGGAGEVGLSKVLLFPEKLAALKDNGDDNRDLSYPVSVELSLTNSCNQKCIWCSDQDLRDRSPDHINFDVLKLLFRDLAKGGTRGVTIEGGGEPTISPLFEPAVRAALAENLAVGLITNGLSLFDDKMDPSIYQDMEWIRVSLDAADRRQYLQTKGVDGFDRVLGNLGRLAEEAPKVTLGVGYVLTNLNDDQDRLQHLALTLRSIEVDYLQIRPVVDHPELVSRKKLTFLDKFSTPEFSVNLSALSDNAPSGNAGLPCLAHSLSTVIGADGAVWLCGRLNTEDDAHPIGNLMRSSFSEIWNGPERARQISLASSPEFCRDNCPQCRMTKYNKLLYDIDRLKTRNFI